MIPYLITRRNFISRWQLSLLVVSVLCSVITSPVTRNNETAHQVDGINLELFNRISSSTVTGCNLQHVPQFLPEQLATSTEVATGNLPLHCGRYVFWLSSLCGDLKGKKSFFLSLQDFDRRNMFRKATIAQLAIPST